MPLGVSFTKLNKPPEVVQVFNNVKSTLFYCCNLYRVNNLNEKIFTPESDFILEIQYKSQSVTWYPCMASFCTFPVI